MTSTQKGILLALVLLNLLVFGAVYVALWSPPGQSPLSAPVTALERLFIVASPTPAPRSAAAPAPALVPTQPRPPLPTATATRRPVARQALATPTPLPPQPPAVPGGSSSANPLLPGDAWQTLGARSIVWYKVGNGGDHIDALLQADLIDGMKMEVFTPDNPERPIGLGTFNRGLNGLAWSGGHWSSLGAWLARVTNGNPAPAQYRVLSATYSIGKCDSTSYWELINGDPVYWTRCK